MEINIPKTDPINGLDDSEAVRSRRLHGTNEITRRRTKGFIRQFIGNLGDPMIKILLIALALNLMLSAGSGNMFESIGIAAAILMSTLVSTISEYGSSLAFAKLSEEASNVNCRVRRNGEVCSVPIGEIVVGDIVLLGAGEMIPADGILISGSLTTDQSSLTGESAECEKVPSPHRNAAVIWDTSEKSQLFRGSTVSAGEGIMLTHRVGVRTFLGGMAQELQENTPDSPLKLRLAKLARQISVIGYCAAILVAAADLANLLFIDGGLYTLTLSGFISHLLHAVTLGLTVVVVAVPEGLPMMITVVLSSNMLRMKRGNVLVRKLVGIETAGSLNILFCDKTGTLTEGELSVTEFCAQDGSRYDKLSDIPTRQREITALSCIMNNSSEFDNNKKPSGGNSTDRAILGFAGYDSISICKEYSKAAYRPYDSTSKYSSALIQGPHSLRLIKGAPEKILPNCTFYLTSDGKNSRLERTHHIKLTDTLRFYTTSACRVIALAVSQSETSGTLKNLTFVGFLILRDNIRSSAKSSIEAIKNAGIQTVMITGDNRETAAAIACELGIAEAPDAEGIITSDSLKLLSDHALKELLPKLRVVARALPSDKSRLVRAAQDSGLVCAMTGDGVNDAPALKRADVGFAMGSGTAVAKEAGDIVITDNNIASIVRAILYGRTVFKSIRRFIVFQLTMNLCAVGISLICPFICGIDTPITVIQMLWINMIMDTLAGLAFSGEPPLEEYLNEPPKPKNEPVVNGEMLTQIIWASIWTAAVCMGFLILPRFNSLFRHSPDDIYILTAFFTLFVFCGIVNSFNTRTTRLNLLAGLTKNKAFAAMIALVVTVQLMLVNFGGSLFRCVPLTADELKCVVLLSLTVIPADLIRKALLRIIPCSTHSVENRNHRHSDIRKDSKPHIRNAERCKQ